MLGKINKILHSLRSKQNHQQREKTSETSVRRVDNLKDRLDALKKSYLENEINVQKAEREANSAVIVANRAESVSCT